MEMINISNTDDAGCIAAQGRMTRSIILDIVNAERIIHVK